MKTNLFLEDNGRYYWETNDPHFTNTETMADFLNNHLPDGFEIITEQGSFAQIISIGTDKLFDLHASGDGDFTHHVISWNTNHANYF